MGFKVSMIIIKEPSKAIDETGLLNELGLPDFSFHGETSFEEAIYPMDKSINIGTFNNCLIICDDYQLTDYLGTPKDPQALSEYEKILTEIYPDSEILTVACHSGVNYHMYSLVKNGQKIRYKRISHGEPLIEFGNRLEEEDRIYSFSKIIGGQRMFRSTYKEDEIYDNTEDQMMEGFAFGVAKRHLGVMISIMPEEDALLNARLKKYLSNKKPEEKIAQKQISTKKTTRQDLNKRWIVYTCILIILIIWQIIKRR